MQSYQRFQCIGHTVFNTSGTYGPRGETGVSPPSATAQSCATSEITLYAVFVTPDSATLLYTYISRFSENSHYQQQLYLRPSFIPIFNFSHKRPTFAFTGESGYTLGFPRRIAHSGSHGETGGHLCVVARSIWLPPHHSKNSRRKWMHANGVCPLSPAPRPCWAAETYSFVTAWSFLHRYQSGQQLELSIKTIRRPNVHCKTECILLQYSEKSLEWRRYMICPLSLFATTS